MDQTLFSRIASSPALHAWARTCEPSVFGGTVRVETRHTTYLFRHGSCFAVTQRDNERGSCPELVGMRLVGWVLLDESTEESGVMRRGVVRVSRVWRPASSAVLFCNRDDGAEIALTSPTLSFQQIGAIRARPPRRLSQSDTLTRVGLPMPERLPDVVTLV